MTMPDRNASIHGDEGKTWPTDRDLAQERVDALDEIINGDWCGDNLPGEVGKQFAALAEALQVGMDDAAIVRMTRHMIGLAVDHITEKS